jgi:hypothetical protein
MTGSARSSQRYLHVSKVKIDYKEVTILLRNKVHTTGDSISILMYAGPVCKEMNVSLIRLASPMALLQKRL